MPGEGGEVLALADGLSVENERVEREMVVGTHGGPGVGHEGTIPPTETRVPSKPLSPT